MKKLYFLLFAALSANVVQAQNVGIGTTSPTEKLQVVGNVKLSDTLKARRVSVGSDSSRYPLAVKAEGTGFAQISGDGTVAVGTYAGQNAAFIQTHSNHDLNFTTNDGAAQMTLQKTTGNVGIGKTNPTEKLDVNGKTKTTNLQVTGGTPGINKILTSDASGNGNWQTLDNIMPGGSGDAGNLGFGAWGDCGTNANISGYQPIDVSDLGRIKGVVMDSNFALVSGSTTSKIYQFDSVQGLWLLAQTLPYAGSIALSKSNLLIGLSGEVKLYQYNGTSWVLAQTITSPAPQTGDFFGGAVAISGNEILISAPYRSIGALSIVGQAYAYSLSGSTATYLHVINTPNPVTSGQFGYSLAISGNKAIIGEPYVPANNVKCYSIRKLTAAVWSNPPTALPISAPSILVQYSPTDSWGSSVTISGDDAMVAGTEGLVFTYKYEPASGTWACKRHIKHDGITNTVINLHIAENFAILGLSPITATSTPSKAIIYQQLQQGNWQRYQSITDPGGEVTSYYEVAISGNRFVLGDYSNRKIMFGKINVPR